MSLALLFLYLMLNMFRMLLHPSSGACDLCTELFHGLYCSGSMCVGVTLWYVCGGVVSVCRLKHYSRNNKASDIKLVSLYSTIKMMHGPINIRFTLKHLKPLRHVSSFSDHHQGVSSFLAKIITYSRCSSLL